MKALQELRIFVETARLGSLSAAARALDLSPAVTSAAVKRLEAELEQTLFVRSTRQLRLTDAGERFLSSCQQALELLDEGYASMQQQSQQLSGQIRISAPSDFGRKWFSDWFDEFITLHPAVSLRLHLADGLTDLYRHPVDLMLRYGDLTESNLVALPLSKDNYRVLVASPSYLEQHGAPAEPTQLERHNCLCFSVDETPFSQWQLWRGTQSMTVKVSGNRVTNDGAMVHRWAVQGHGIAFKSIVDIRDDLINGRLVKVCEAWRSNPVPLNLLCASRNQVTPTIRALQQFLQQKLVQHLADLS